jgi:hypothetical protein
MKKWGLIGTAILALLLLIFIASRHRSESRTTTGAVSDVEEYTVPGDVNSDSDSPGLEASPVVAAAGAPSKSAAGLPSAAEIDKIRAATRALLASSISGELSYKAETDHFTTDLKMFGWAPNEVEMNYKMGFLAPSSEDTQSSSGGAREDPKRLTTDAFIGEESEDSNQKIQYSIAADKIRLSDYANVCQNGCTANAENFEIMVAVPLDDQGHVDVWTVHANKEMKLVRDGTK